VPIPFIYTDIFINLRPAILSLGRLYY
jgi:hypothetical protein